MRFPDIGLEVPRILLPGSDVPVDTWAVIACDQHTSDPGYWEDVVGRVGTAPSTIQLVFPEAYLEADDRPQRISRIRAAMADYSTRGVLQELPAGFVLVDRQTPHVASRRGLLVALDLEQYSYDDGARTLIRTTEGTVVSRLAPRIEIRRDTPLELPHIMVLIDDPQRTVIEPLFDCDLPALYDTELMLGGGRVRGWHVKDDALVEQVVASLRRLIVDVDDAPMLYVMGDGNHSFATAQAVWQEIKNTCGGLDAVAEHPARHRRQSPAKIAGVFRIEVDAVEGGAGAMAALAGAGLRIGLVSDTSLAGGRHLRGYLEAHGMLGHIGHCSFSDEVGVYKPDAAIFRDCLAGLGIDDPAGVVHVGDLRRTDVAGARAFGMTTVRFRGVVEDDAPDEGDEDGPEADHVIDRLADLPALLGLSVRQ